MKSEVSDTRHPTPDPLLWKPGQFKALLFDVDGTLYRQKPLRKAMMVRLGHSYVLRPLTGWRVTQILSAYRKAQEVLRETNTEGTDLAQAQLQWAAEKTGAAVQEIQQHVEFWMEQAPLPILARFVQPSLVDFLQSAQTAGVRMGVFSDYPAEAKLEAMGLKNYFEVMVAAQEPEVGRFKPHPRGIEVGLERLGVAPHEVLYIGDRAEVDAVAAAHAGVACAILSKEPSSQATLTYRQVAGYAELKSLLY